MRFIVHKRTALSRLCEPSLTALGYSSGIVALVSLRAAVSILSACVRASSLEGEMDCERQENNKIFFCEFEKRNYVSKQLVS